MDKLEDIRRLRKMMDLTQKELAIRTGTSQSLIAKIESGKIDPSYSRVKAIFDALHGLEENHSVKLKDVMNRRVIYVEKKDGISKAVRLMKSHSISQLPVLDKGCPVGSISEKTIWDRMAAGEDLRSLSAMKVESVIEEAFPQVDEDTPMNIVSDLLARKYAIIVTKKGKIVGITTKADVLKMI